MPTFYRFVTNDRIEQNAFSLEIGFTTVISQFNKTDKLKLIAERNKSNNLKLSKRQTERN